MQTSRALLHIHVSQSINAMLLQQAAHCQAMVKRSTHVTLLTSASRLIEDTSAGWGGWERFTVYSAGLCSIRFNKIAQMDEGKEAKSDHRHEVITTPFLIKLGVAHKRVSCASFSL